MPRLLFQAPYVLNVILREWITISDSCAVNSAMTNVFLRPNLLQNLIITPVGTAYFIDDFKFIDILIQSSLIVSMTKPLTLIVISYQSHFFYKSPYKSWLILNNLNDSNQMVNYNVIKDDITVSDVQQPITVTQGEHFCCFSLWVNFNTNIPYLTVSKETQSYEANTVSDRYTFGVVQHDCYMVDELHPVASLSKHFINTANSKSTLIYTYTGDVSYDTNYNGIGYIDCDENANIPSTTYAMHYSKLWPGIIQHGEGSAKSYVCGNSYSGDWVRGKREGNGVLRYENGDVYTGQWLQHSKHGQGTMEYENGNIYTGAWRYNVTYGKGTIQYKNAVLEGEWGEQLMRGTGELTMDNGDVFAGQFHKDYLYGQVSVSLKNGGQFVGEFDHYTVGEVGNDVFSVPCQNNRCECESTHCNEWFENVVTVCGRLKLNGEREMHGQYAPPIYKRNKNQQWVWVFGKQLPK